MTNPTTPKEVTQAAVIQADRDAAKAAHGWIGGELAQHFAAHRIAATERAAAIADNYGEDPAWRAHGRNIATAIGEDARHAGG